MHPSEGSTRSRRPFLYVVRNGGATQTAGESFRALLRPDLTLRIAVVVRDGETRGAYFPVARALVAHCQGHSEADASASIKCYGPAANDARFNRPKSRRLAPVIAGWLLFLTLALLACEPSAPHGSPRVSLRVPAIGSRVGFLWRGPISSPTTQILYPSRQE